MGLDISKINSVIQKGQTASGAAGLVDSGKDAVNTLTDKNKDFDQKLLDIMTVGTTAGGFLPGFNIASSSAGIMISVTSLADKVQRGDTIKVSDVLAVVGSASMLVGDLMTVTGVGTASTGVGAPVGGGIAAAGLALRGVGAATATAAIAMKNSDLINKEFGTKISDVELWDPQNKSDLPTMSDVMGQVKETLKDTLSNASDKIVDTANSTAEKIKDAANNVKGLRKQNHQKS